VRTPNALTGLAGEYAVAAKMALHGWHASQTIKTFSEVDLVAYKHKTDKKLTVLVKAGRHGAWSVDFMEFDGKKWNIQQLYEHADVYVLVALPVKSESTFSFYVIPTSRLKAILLQHAPAKYGNLRTKKPQPCWINQNTLDHRAEWQMIAQHKDSCELLDEVAR
jgi:hypothetical protein